MAKRKKRGPRKVAIRYSDSRNQIEYVPRTPAELRREITRVQSNVLRATKILSRLKRIRHIALVTARFQLAHCLRDVKETDEEEVVADEIARLSFVMEDTLGLLNRLEHSRTRWLEEARFVLTYGQTPKKREPAGSYGSGPREDG